ncbi:MAG: phage tail protein, partial [Peptostreptococcaceae bacterium]|nr:phage tail protein [Peptostreptococcaceae bacterium]
MLTLHNKDFTTKYGTINTTIEAFVEEERNGLFELSFIMLNTDSLFNYVKEDNIVVANANDTLLNQKFRIYMTRKLMNNRVEVFARHISFDLMYDYIDSISFENQSCEYALNMLFRNSQFSTHYRGYSDIINAQDYSMSMANILEAIGGKQGSIIDTFGTGAEILRDNENVHVLNKRGHDNSVSIEYKKNLTGFELEEDTTDLVTRILPYAKYDDEENGEVIIKASFVDSPLIFNYSHPFIKAIDYSDKFEEGEIITEDKLKALASNEYKNNKVDIPKQNFKIEFMPLSKCVGYEALSDSISLCDTVNILDTRYNINTKAKVIKTTFNVLKNRYESMELGEPRTSLGDIVGNGSGNNEGPQGPQGPQGPPGADGNIGDFPNSLPPKSVLTGKSIGLASIELTWTFENKVYYSY